MSLAWGRSLQSIFNSCSGVGLPNESGRDAGKISFVLRILFRVTFSLPNMEAKI